MVIRRRVRTLGLAAMSLAMLPVRAWADSEDTEESGPAVAAPTPASVDPARGPGFHHAPVAVGRAHAPLTVLADLTDAHLVRHAFVVYRSAGKKELGSVELQRTAGEAGYRADIPAGDVQAPFVEYTVELELADGKRTSVFASRTAMHRVSVPVDYLDLREQALLERLHGRRSVSAVRVDFVSFGRSQAFVANAGGAATVNDRFYRVEGAYTFRPLRTVTEFTVKLGVLRGHSPAADARTPGDLDVGLNYTAPSVRLRLVDWLHVDLEGLTSVTEKGFELGGAAQVLLGDPFGSQVLVGAQSLHGFGSRFWSRVDIPAGPRLVLSPIVETTNWPHADQYGVRLLFEVAADLANGLGGTLGGGYQARESASGGPSVMAAARYAF